MDNILGRRRLRSVFLSQAVYKHLLFCGAVFCADFDLTSLSAATFVLGSPQISRKGAMVHEGADPHGAESMDLLATSDAPTRKYRIDYSHYF